MTTHIEKLLAVKRTLKRTQPVFKRQQSGRKKVGTEWRRPKGLHSKMKDGLKGYPMARKMGFRTPLAVRGLDLSGKLPVRVERLAQLEGLHAAQHSIVLAKVGLKAKREIIAAAQKKGLSFVNVKQRHLDALGKTEKKAAHAVAPAHAPAAHAKKAKPKKEAAPAEEA